MPFNPNDVAGFPPPSTFREIDWASLCQLADPAKVVPVAYAFGGAAPDAITLSDGAILRTSNVVNASRVLVEFDPYGWNPET